MPPAPRTLPSASGSAGRPPPAGSAPCRNSLSTRHRAEDTCQNHILLLARPRQAWGHRQSLCGSSCHTPCPKPLVFEPPMSYPLCLSLPCPSPCIPAHISPPMLHHSVSAPCPSLCVPAPPSKPPRTSVRSVPQRSGASGRSPGAGMARASPPRPSRPGGAWGGVQGPRPAPVQPVSPGLSLGRGTGQVGCASPPAWLWHPAPQNETPSLTQRCCDGFDPLQALLCQLQQFGGVGGDPLAVLCGEGVLGSLQDFHRGNKGSVLPYLSLPPPPAGPGRSG